MASSNGSGSPVIVVTGASRGLGRAVALRCGNAGWRVVVHYREQRDAADSTALAITRTGGEALVVQADVTQRGAFPDMVARTIARWGRIDAWINNAGMVDDHLTISMPEAAWDHVIAVNLTAARRAIQAVAPVMRKQGNGAILNVASIAALQGRRGQSAYSAAKAGLIALTRTAALELGSDNIRVNAVCPPVLDTESVGSHAGSLRTQQLLPETISPDSPAEVVLSILSMPWISGHTFVLDSRIPEGAL